MPEFDPLLSLRALTANKGSKISGEAAGDAAGLAVASAGDVNGDGFDDVLIGAPFTAPGQVRVVQQGPNTIVEINLSGDAAPEMTIALEDVTAATLTQMDFIL